MPFKGYILSYLIIPDVIVKPLEIRTIDKHCIVRFHYYSDPSFAPYLEAETTICLIYMQSNNLFNKKTKNN